MLNESVEPVVSFVSSTWYWPVMLKLPSPS
jgi:hypothetical protein